MLPQTYFLVFIIYKNNYWTMKINQEEIKKFKKTIINVCHRQTFNTTLLVKNQRVTCLTMIHDLKIIFSYRKNRINMFIP